jgi:hypothetical protein
MKKNALNFISEFSHCPLSSSHSFLDSIIFHQVTICALFGFPGKLASNERPGSSVKHLLHLAADTLK